MDTSRSGCASRGWTRHTGRDWPAQPPSALIAAISATPSSIAKRALRKGCAWPACRPSVKPATNSIATAMAWETCMANRASSDSTNGNTTGNVANTTSRKIRMRPGSPRRAASNRRSPARRRDSCACPRARRRRWPAPRARAAQVPTPLDGGPACGCAWRGASLPCPRCHDRPAGRPSAGSAPGETQDSLPGPSGPPGPAR